MVPGRAPHRDVGHPADRERREARARHGQGARGRRPPDRARQPRAHVRNLHSPSNALAHPLTCDVASYVSPRTRAQRTLELLDLGCRDRFPWAKDSGEPTSTLDARTNASIEITDRVREWDYGDYEGIKSAEVRELRKQRGLNEDWDIWRDGCEGGESPEDVTKRLDELIAELREKHHKGKFGKDGKPNDVLIVAHGHILRAFAARWIGKRLEDNPSLILEAGGVGTLSYEHHRIEEPAILLGGAFVVDAIEKEEEGK